MKRLFKKKEGLVRGVPSAVFLSALIHFILLSVAGGLIVFSVIKRPEKVFVPPPPAERPKTPLIKPRVKMKKNVKPGATRRIVSKQTLGMPDMQLPAIEGMGQGLGGGVGGFELMPDAGDMSIFGGAKSMAIGNDFEGTFYSAAYDRLKKKTNVDEEGFKTIVRRFIDSGWNPTAFAPYYRAPQKLYTTQIFVPTISSEFGPSYFGIPAGPDFDPYLWCAHYKGKIARKDGGRYRFWGFADDILLVRVNGKLVLNASYEEFRNELTAWERQPEDYKYNIGPAQVAVGLWFDLEPGVPVDMEILIGEIPGGQFCAYLLVQKEGEYYPKNREGMPVLPVFKTAEIPEAVKDKIKYDLIDGEGDLDSDLMFNVH
ncbi:MAG: hypothetical protein PHP93_05110 [Kiritimatiellales bacterium]|nr:hypothetical protein [Kiritimatiellales bacterium]